MSARGSDGVTVREAARALGVGRTTLLSWIRRGAPTRSLGTVGRGHGSTVDPEELRQWRAARALMSAAPTALTGRCDLAVVARAVWRLYTKPPDGSTVQLIAPLPKDFRAALNMLRKYARR